MVRVSDDVAVVFTADFITPVVDDPREWGRIAAANSISDVFAMGAAPLAALNLMAWPNCLGPSMMADVMAGGADAAREAGCLVVGGHTIQDNEPKYGMAVIGTVRPDRIIKNVGAKPGDFLYLTKPIGTGIVATAIKGGQASEGQIEPAVISMKTLNRRASEIAADLPARAMTDVTGFGLAGHLTEMLGPAENGLGATSHLPALPILPGAIDLIQAGMVPGGAYRNRDAYRGRVEFPGPPDAPEEILLYDPQTSGGLLIAVAEDRAAALESRAAAADCRMTRIGSFDRSGKIRIAL